ncbi:MAG: hypothetical protein VXW22_13895, partial [Pseudomonadota bacterium]|nr:hypothetical protein [Pseudomonadota bacterium]
MKVEAQPSPNFNDRKHPVDMLVLHYTGMETGEAALARMQDEAASVSSAAFPSATSGTSAAARSVDAKLQVSFRQLNEQAA